MNYRPNIVAMRGYTPGEQPQSDDTVKLNTNENPHPCSPQVRAAVGRAVDERRRLLRAELPAVAQLLALRIRAGGSVSTAIGVTATRCHGEVADALSLAVATHRAGRPLDEALDGLAAATPEPEAARLYRLLAGSVRWGLDAAPELLRLAREGRTAHLTRLRRDATRRRGAMLLPVIGLLAPLMLLFIAAPLPSLISGTG